jgi:hypothetical protein
MDDVLASRPQAFRMLRAFWKLSFLKFDDEEDQAFRDVLLKHNQDALLEPEPGESVFQTDFKKYHQKLVRQLSHANYQLQARPFIEQCAEGSILHHEMVLELGLLAQLSARDPETVQVFGHWDYLSHQVVASPFKPVDYMDKMDLFGYACIPGFAPTRARYLVAELKKDTAHLEHLEQLMKYVDWVKAEYAYGDYAMIHAYLVAHDFDDHVLEQRDVIGTRKFTHGMRPAMSSDWRNLKLVRYAQRGGQLIFTEVKDGALTLFTEAG